MTVQYHLFGNGLKYVLSTELVLLGCLINGGNVLSVCLLG